MSSLRIQTAMVALGATILVSTAMAWPGKPLKAPPKPPNPGAPPPAWIETQAKSAWLAYGSYCWTAQGQAVCADMIAPEDRPDLPVLAVKRGAVIRVHLSFSVRSASVSLDRGVVRVKLSTTKRVLSWTATRGGILTIFTRPAVGDASYVARLRVR